MPKLGPDHLFTLYLAPPTDVQFMTTLRRIRVRKGLGWNVVLLNLEWEGEIEMSRPLAERLRDDLTRWLKQHPPETEEDWLRLAGYKKK